MTVTLSGLNTGTSTIDTAAQTHAATTKATPVDADEIPLADSAASFGLKKLTWGNLKANIPDAVGFRNRIIGGDFTVNPWQRGTSFTAPASGAYTADRFVLSYSADAVVNVLKTADAPTAVEAGVYTAHCLHIDVTTADATIATTQYFAVVQPIEGFNAASFGFGKAGTRYVTLSFWVKSTKTGIFSVAFRNATGRSYVEEYIVNATNTWEKKTVTIPVDTSGTWLYDNGVGLSIFWTLACGSGYQITAGSWVASNYLASTNQVNALDSTANDFKLALIQLEPGSTATTFEQRPYGVELALCRRYYERLTYAAGSTGPAGGYAQTTSIAYLSFPAAPKRSAPTVALTGAGTAQVLYTGGASITFTAGTVYGAADRPGTTIQITTATVLTANQTLALYANGGAVNVDFSSEL